MKKKQQKEDSIFSKKKTNEYIHKKKQNIFCRKIHRTLLKNMKIHNTSSLSVFFEKIAWLEWRLVSNSYLIKTKLKLQMIVRCDLYLKWMNNKNNNYYSVFDINMTKF